MQKQMDETIEKLLKQNKEYKQKYKDVFAHHIEGQSPKIAILTCADSRVIPEFIFNASIGEFFVVRIAGNISVDKTVLASLEYAVEHLHITHLIILAHTYCGAVKAAEQSPNSNNLLLTEIQDSFCLDDKNHVQANLKRQLQMLPKRSKVIQNALSTGSLKLIGAIYYLEDGSVRFR